MLTRGKYVWPAHAIAVLLVRMRSTDPTSVGEMACLRVLVVAVLALQSAQLSWGDIIELEKFRPEPPNYLEYVFDRNLPTAAKDDASSVNLASVRVTLGCVELHNVFPYSVTLRAVLKGVTFQGAAEV